tara:strand:+ start:64 stop:333 length:270 start_codon:yes stop_codon:yes gene_type:complete
MSNPFEGVGASLNGSVQDIEPVTPHDSNLFANGTVAIGLYITVGGAIKIKTVKGTDRTMTVPDNFYLVCACKQVFATGTAATGIHALVA